jgi:hypothetical protein
MYLIPTILYEVFNLTPSIAFLEKDPDLRQDDIDQSLLFSISINFNLLEKDPDLRQDDIEQGNSFRRNCIRK